MKRLYIYCCVVTIYGLLLLNSVIGNLINKRSATEEPSQCYANINDPYTLFATKTSYFEVENEDVAPIKVEGKILFSLQIILTPSQFSGIFLTASSSPGPSIY